MSKKVSLINMKGGVGKSTLAVNLAWHFAAYSDWQKKVLVIDLDPQFNSSQYLLGVNKYQSIIDKNLPTIWDVFEQYTTTPSSPSPKALDPHTVVFPVVSYRGGGKVDLVPSRLELANSLKSPGQKEFLVQNLVKSLEEDYDLVLIDCAPTESLLTDAAYLASDYILVPVKPEFLSTIGLPLLVKSMATFQQKYSHSLSLAGVVFNSTTDYYPEEITTKNTVRKIARSNKWYVFNNQVTYSRSYPKGAREGRPIFSTSYSRSKQISAFHKVASEFAGRISL